MAGIQSCLGARRDASTGQLFRLTAEGHVERRAFEHILGGLTRAGLLRVGQDSFQKEGRVIHFQRAALTPAGRRAEAEALAAVRLTQEPPKAPRRRSQRTRKSRHPAHPSAGGALRLKKESLVDGREPPAKLVEALSTWRLDEARRRRTPAFHILTDRTINGLNLLTKAQAEGLISYWPFNDGNPNDDAAGIDPLPTAFDHGDRQNGHTGTLGARVWVSSGRTDGFIGFTFPSIEYELDIIGQPKWVDNGAPVESWDQLDTQRNILDGEFTGTFPSGNGLAGGFFVSDFTVLP